MEQQSLGKSQRAILDYIIKCISENGVSPSIREICAAVGLSSTASVQFHLDTLEKKGYIERDPLHKRSIRVKGWMGGRARQVPVLGVVAAGTPIFADENIEDYISYSGSVSSDKELFALRVRGDSMIEMGIFTDDIVIAEKTPYAENGDLVVALVDDEATLKSFFKEDGHYRLQPANSAYEPIIVDKVEILGKILSLTRNFKY